MVPLLAPATGRLVAYKRAIPRISNWTRFNIISEVEMPSFRSLVRVLGNRIYQPQVMLEFPRAVVEKQARMLPPLREGYEIRHPSTEAECESWAALLNEDPGFGTWTPERIKAELLSKLIDPRAATLLLHQGRPIACGCFIDASTRRKRVALGMFLYVAPAYRGRAEVAQSITYLTMPICFELGCDRVIGTTDPTRLSVLLLHLRNGALPIKNSLYSHIQWYRIFKRLRPTLDALARRKSRGTVC